MLTAALHASASRCISNIMQKKHIREANIKPNLPKEVLKAPPFI